MSETTSTETDDTTPADDAVIVNETVTEQPVIDETVNTEQPIVDEAMGRLPTVVIIGRPNVGKSTLFNRIIGSQQAIVEDRPGITRDRKMLEASWLEVPFLIIDTGGWMPAGDGTELDDKVSQQVEEAVDGADVVMFVVDASVGLTDDDSLIANWLRRSRHDVMVIANKADNDRRETDRWEFISLGLGDPIPVSALHGRRAGDLLDEVINRFPASARTARDESEYEMGPDFDDSEIKPPRIAIVGRPNVGKSTLFNKLVGEDRAVVHDMAGTTRDSIDTLVETEDGPMVFIDTAGMRRKGKIDDSAEYYSMVRALRAIDDADVALLVIDGTEGVTSQDQRLAERVNASGCPILLVLNKWELVSTEDRLEVMSELHRKLAFVGDAPILKISALTGKNVNRLLPHLQESIAQYHTRVPTRDINKVIAAAQQRAPGPKGAKVLYAVQGATDPPTFTLFVNREIPATYMRYIERTIREEFGLGSTAIKMRVRKRS
jgi:GTP-binding protein